MNQIQEINDAEYALSLGYNVDIFESYNHELVQERLEDDMIHSFDYEKKTKEYLESMYY